MSPAGAWLLAACVLSGCRSRPFDEPLDSSDGPRAPLDLGRAIDFAQFDFAQFDLTQFDLTQPIDLAAESACARAVDCLAACGPWSPGEPDCFAGCSVGAATVTDGWCGDDYCLGGFLPVAQPSYQRCALDATMTKYVDAVGAPPGDCQVCLHHVFANLLGQPCPAGDPACDPSLCSFSRTSCGP